MRPLRSFLTWYRFNRLVRHSWREGGPASMSVAGGDSDLQTLHLDPGLERSRVLRVLNDHFALDVAEIASATSLPPDYVRAVLDELMAEGLVHRNFIRGSRMGYILPPMFQVRMGT